MMTAPFAGRSPVGRAPKAMSSRPSPSKSASTRSVCSPVPAAGTAFDEKLMPVLPTGVGGSVVVVGAPVVGVGGTVVVVMTTVGGVKFTEAIRTKAIFVWVPPVKVRSIRPSVTITLTVRSTIGFEVVVRTRSCTVVPSTWTEWAIEPAWNCDSPTATVTSYSPFGTLAYQDAGEAIACQAPPVNRYWVVA